VPGGDSARAPLLLLHGTGGDENDLLPLGRDGRAGSGAALAARQGAGGPMPRFFRRLAEGVFDTQDVMRRAHELADFVERRREPVRPRRKPVAVGFSNGANIAAAMLLLRPEVLAGAVLLRAMVPLPTCPASAPT
jgi:phospholipase/carboxylesterase